MQPSFNRNFLAAGRLPKGRMNKTEKEYSILLATKKLAGEILDWKFQPVKFMLGYNTSYTPDFQVINKNGFVEYHEVKSFWTDDAKAKTKICASMHPYFIFIAVYKGTKKNGGGWRREELTA